MISTGKDGDFVRMMDGGLGPNSVLDLSFLAREDKTKQLCAKGLKMQILVSKEAAVFCKKILR